MAGVLRTVLPFDASSARHDVGIHDTHDRDYAAPTRASKFVRLVRQGAAHAPWARKFFDNWKAQLRWQRLQPYEKFAKMIERHWDGIAAYCKPENKVALGFVEGLNNKIRVIQRRAYGLRDEEYLRLKILTMSLPEL